ncbi:DUF3071 domain-containing protein [Leucobacter sp. CSA1]|uniref:DUF3071 domain-containing protein n=1 Tax=Leucobacter chromiisoli TaxID=2796471 RepID=A0A934UTT2_9MICO|nr:septation protein SepH [Leucobacter chromiisoli]MBK0418070.1 DUF3071 domain-containing protein [Leucobacter chromiisoli]
MDELRLVRREDRSLVVATESGEEFRLIVDDSVLSELRHLSRRGRETSKIRPREIQALIRSGKSRSEVAELTGIDEVDIERYEEPVLAERRYILERAHAVPVRTGNGDPQEEQFGAVIAERLIGLSAERSDWSSWRDEEAGWMIGLDFVSHDIEHRAVWSFEHRKGVLSPVNPDAVTLSKQGEVGDRLIPKLRAVDAAARAEGAAPDDSSETAEHDGSDPGGAEEAPIEEHPAEPDRVAEYARRREIDQRAISTTPSSADLGQTADLLDALRRRRGEREQELDREQGGSAPDSGSHGSETAAPSGSADATRAGEDATSVPLPTLGRRALGEADRAPADGAEREDPTRRRDPGASQDASSAGKAQPEAGRRRRASIPSWDDILFGTRSEDDPA